MKIKISILLLMLWPTIVLADHDNEYHVTIKNHTIIPKNISVNAHKKFQLIIDNQDPTPEEIESHDLNREKIVGPHKKITLYLGPLKPGVYRYFGEFNQKTAQGTITVQ